MDQSVTEFDAHTDDDVLNELNEKNLSIVKRFVNLVLKLVRMITKKCSKNKD